MLFPSVERFVIVSFQLVPEPVICPWARSAVRVSPEGTAMSAKAATAIAKRRRTGASVTDATFAVKPPVTDAS